VRIQTTVVDVREAHGHRTDCFISAEPTATIGQLANAIAMALPGRNKSGEAPTLWLSDRELLGHQTVEDSGIRAGVVIGMGGPVGGVSRPPALYQLEVFAGPDQGWRAELTAGTHLVGRAQYPQFRDRDMSRLHAQIDITDVGATVRDRDSSNGTTLDGVKVGSAPEEAVEIVSGQILSLGQNRAILTALPEPDVKLRPFPDDPSILRFNRPPRVRRTVKSQEVTLQPPPGDREKRALLSVALYFLLPVAGAVIAATVLRQPMYLLFGLMGPAMGLGSMFAESRLGSKRHRRESELYAAASAAANEQLAAALTEERADRHRRFPSPAAVVRFALGPNSRLWERHPTDEDFLELRVGIGDVAATTRVKSNIVGESEPLILSAVPLTVDLRSAGVVGIAGDDRWTEEVARWLLMQLAGMHSPADITLCLVTESQGDRWQWMRWLPHAMPIVPAAAVVNVGLSPATIEARLGELSDVLTGRVESRLAGRNAARNQKAIVVVVDGARDLSAYAGLTRLLDDGPDHGIYTICIETERQELPKECQSFLVQSSRQSGRATLYIPGGDELHVICDSSSPEDADQLARAISPLRDVSSPGSGGHLPELVPLLPLLELNSTEPEVVRDYWMRNPRRTRVPVGVTAEGPYTIDLDDDGPHALVAGMTRMGKSEFLRTWIAALGATNHPETLNFLLFDYKGNAAFQDCARLPHTVETITDLDEDIAERALASLGAELKRRERVLSAARAQDLAQYVELGAPGGPLPRLMIVIDEFRALITAVPAFVDGLVDVAARGGSLGLHLVLATQKPSGNVVSPHIKSQTNLRVALRVADTTDSTEIMDSPVAAHISPLARGRAFARVGQSSLIPFQAALIGRRRVRTRQSSVDVTPAPWYSLDSVVDDTDENAADPRDTDLAALVEQLRSAAQLAGIKEQEPPWRPRLKTVVTAAEVSALQKANTSPLSIPYGLEDRPWEQDQVASTFDIDTQHSLLIAGESQSGRTTCLRTIAGQIALRCNPDDVHLYAIDCGAGQLNALATLPHVGIVAGRREVGRIARLLERLTGEVRNRQEVLAAVGAADINEHRAIAPCNAHLPYVVLLIDRWEGFLSELDTLDGGRLTDMVIELLTEGVSAGFRLIVTGDRRALTGRLPAYIETKIVLRFRDPNDYTMAGLTRAPSSPPAAGRGFRVSDRVEIQLATLSHDPSGKEQTTAIAALATRLPEMNPRNNPPFIIEPLPTRIRFEDVAGLASPDPPPLTPLIAVGGDTLMPISVDLLNEGPGFVIGGPRRSGRSNALCVIVESLIQGGSQVVLLSPRRSPLRTLKERAGVAALVTGTNPDPVVVGELLNPLDGPLAVVIDDGELLLGADIQDLLQQVAREGSDNGHVLIVAGTTQDLLSVSRGYTAEARKGRTGLLLRPENPQQGALFGTTSLLRTEMAPAPPGRGFLFRNGVRMPVQVPLIVEDDSNGGD